MSFNTHTVLNLCVSSAKNFFEDVLANIPERTTGQSRLNKKTLLRTIKEGEERWGIYYFLFTIISLLMSNLQRDCREGTVLSNHIGTPNIISELDI